MSMSYALSALCGTSGRSEFPARDDPAKSVQSSNTASKHVRNSTFSKIFSDSALIKA